jgi:hypothetical protein
MYSSGMSTCDERAISDIRDGRNYPNSLTQPGYDLIPPVDMTR